MSYNTLNPYFNFYGFTPEQNLYQDLTDEYIKIAGTELLYIPKDKVNVDSIFGEPYQALHKRYYPIAGCLKDLSGYEGNPDYMTQFGIQFQPEADWIISKRMFRNLNIPERHLRPNEGDLILVGAYNQNTKDPIFTNSLFEMTYVKREDYQNWHLGAYYVWVIHCQLYIVSYEKFETDNAHIDRINTQYNNTSDLTQGINSNLDIKRDELIDFSEINPFGNL